MRQMRHLWLICPKRNGVYEVGRRYRNRRIGEFLKELDLTEGRSTGIPKILREMAANGSPVPEFDSDDDRTSYLVRLPVHPQAKTAGQAKTGPAQSRAQSRAPVTDPVTDPVGEPCNSVIGGSSEIGRASCRERVYVLV